MRRTASPRDAAARPRPIGPAKTGNPVRIAAPPPPAIRSPPAAVPDAAAVAAGDLPVSTRDARASQQPNARASEDTNANDIPGGEGGPCIGSDSDGDHRIPFSAEDIPVSRRSGDHARYANAGAPILVYDRNGVRFL